MPVSPMPPVTVAGLTTDVDDVSAGLVFHEIFREPVSVVGLASPLQLWSLVASLIVPLILAPLMVTGVPPLVGVAVQLLAVPLIFVASLLVAPPDVVERGLKLALALIPVHVAV